MPYVISRQPDRLRCVVEEGTMRVVELKPDEKPPHKDDAVFVCRPMDYALAMRTPVGSRANGAGREKWEEFLLRMAREYIVDWENVVAIGKGNKREPVPFDSEMMVNGTVHPDVTTALVMHLLNRAPSPRRARRKKAAASASSRKRRPGSGATGKARATARPARR